MDCSTIDSNCVECNAVSCTSCMSGYSLNSNECCLSVAQNAVGCKVYKNNCSNDCDQCAFGYYKLEGQCITLPC